MCGEGYPDRPGRASSKEGESWITIMARSLASIRRSCEMPLRSRRRVVAGTFAFSAKSTPRKRRRATRHQACDEIPSTNVLLRGGADGIRALSADQEAWSRLHRGGPLAHPEKAGRSCKDEPARCDGLGQVIARRGIDRGLGAR